MYFLSWGSIIVASINNEREHNKDAEIIKNIWFEVSDWKTGFMYTTILKS